jgi:hypothetical protein
MNTCIEITRASDAEFDRRFISGPNVEEPGWELSWGGISQPRYLWVHSSYLVKCACAAEDAFR